MNKKYLAYVEHYVYGTAGTAAGIVLVTLKAPGHHNFKSVLWALAAGLVVPAIAKLNPASLANTISKKTGVPEALVAQGIATATTDAEKTIAANNK